MAAWVYVVIAVVVVLVVVLILFTKRKRWAALLLLLLLLLGVGALIWDGRVFTKAAGGVPPDSGTKVLPGGTIRDGDTVVGDVKNPNEKLDYDVVVEGATQFSLVDTSNKVELELDHGNNSDFAVIPGPYSYGVAQPGTYHLKVGLPEGATGNYSFRVVMRKIRKHDVRIGDVIKGHFDTPGQVDVYAFPVEPGQKVTIADSQPCQDVTMGYTDDPDKPLVYTPGNLCWDFESNAVTKDELAIVVWSEGGKPADYNLTVKPAA